MTIESNADSNIHLDDHVDDQLNEYLNLDNPRSFFLFAGAGSGKTRSLVKALIHVRNEHGRQLTLRGQQVGVITYTNAACDEIKRRIDFDPLFYVSTIHSFAWELIQNFSKDIKEWLRANLLKEIDQLQAEEAKGRGTGSKASVARLAKIESKGHRLQRLDMCKSFVYSPTGDNRETNALNHSEVIAICASFLSSKALMQWILVGRFPLLLIDESQDTNKYLVDAFFATAKAHEGRFGLGLIGDVMQRIYADGKDKIEQGLPETWGKPTKKLNHRCPKRVVTLINQIRSAADDQRQEPRDDAIEGLVRLYIRHIDSADRQTIENTVRDRMAELANDANWRIRDECKILTLEHHMAAKRLGFENLLNPLLAIDAWRTGLFDGTLPATRFFTQNVLPLVEAELRKDKFTVARIVRSQSPLITPETLKAAPDSGQILRKAQDAVSSLIELWANGEPSCGQVLDSIQHTGLFIIPEVLKPAAILRALMGEDEINDPSPDKLSTEMEALLGFLKAPFSQVGIYKQYVSGLASFDTHQGVKGLEFDRVMVIMDDAEARGFMFGYEKLFGAKDATATDIKNIQEGKETGVDRTRRLFYVTCSRAEKSLALVAYTEAPASVKRHALENGWFTEEEIDCEL